MTTEHIVTEKPERCPAWNHGTISGQCAHPAGHDDSHQLYLGAGLAISWWGENEPEPSTEEPERTLTAVEDDAIREPWSDPNDEITGADWPTTDAEKVTADVDAKTAEAAEL